MSPNSILKAAPDAAVRERTVRGARRETSHICLSQFERRWQFQRPGGVRVRIGQGLLAGRENNAQLTNVTSNGASVISSLPEINT